MNQLGGAELAPFPDVEALGPHILDGIGAPVDVETPPELGERDLYDTRDVALPLWITFIRAGGGDDGVTDLPLIELTTYGPTRRASMDLTRAAAARVLASGLTAPDGTTLIDSADTYTGPVEQRDQNPDLRVIRTYYTLALRRPR